MGEGEDQPGEGILGSLRKLGDVALAAVQNRLELFAVELQEEKLRLVELIACTMGVILLAFLAVVLGTLTVVMLLPEPWRLPVLGFFTLLYLASAATVGLRLRNRVRNSPGPFAESLGQLRKDRECIKPESKPED